MGRYEAVGRAEATRVAASAAALATVRFHTAHPAEEILHRAVVLEDQGDDVLVLSLLLFVRGHARSLLLPGF